MMSLCSRIRRRRIRIAENQRRADQSAAVAKHIEQQWPAVTAAATWARETREANHLTELFLAGRRK